MAAVALLRKFPDLMQVLYLEDTTTASTVAPELLILGGFPNTGGQL